MYWCTDILEVHTFILKNMRPTLFWTCLYMYIHEIWGINISANFYCQNYKQYNVCTSPISIVDLNVSQHGNCLLNNTITYHCLHIFQLMSFICVQDTALNTVKILQYYGFMVFQLSLRCQLSLVNMSPDHSIVIKILQIKQVSTALLFMCVLLHQQYWSLTVNMVLNSYFGIYRMMVVGWDDMLWTYWLFLTRQNDTK